MEHHIAVIQGDCSRDQFVSVLLEQAATICKCSADDFWEYMQAAKIELEIDAEQQAFAAGTVVATAMLLESFLRGDLKMGEFTHGA